jgi:hypothetical protein
MKCENYICVFIIYVPHSFEWQDRLWNNEFLRIWKRLCPSLITYERVVPETRLRCAGVCSAMAELHGPWNDEMCRQSSALQAFVPGRKLSMAICCVPIFYI